MKFNFKIQPFQTEATDAVIKVFSGQPKQNNISYRRDVGDYEKPIQQQLTEEPTRFIFSHSALR